MSTLASALSQFVSRYLADARLVAEQRGWNCTITLQATDSGEVVSVRIHDGHVVGQGAAAQEGNRVVIVSESATLCDILELRRCPNEPYLFGELTVQGPQGDFVRLDYIAEKLCPT